MAIFHCYVSSPEAIQVSYGLRVGEAIHPKIVTKYWASRFQASETSETSKEQHQDRPLPIAPCLEGN